MGGQAASGVRAWPFPAFSPSQAPDSYFGAWTDGSDQSLTPLYSPSLEGPARAPGTPQEGTSLPPQPASCPFPGSNWTADPRESQHLGLPSTARRPRRGWGRRHEAPERRPAEGLGEVGSRAEKAVVRGREARRKTEMVGKVGGREMDNQEQPERGEKDSEREGSPDKRRSSQLRTGEGGRGREGMEAVKTDGAGEGRGGSWPGEAGAQHGPALPSPAWPSPQ